VRNFLDANAVGYATAPTRQALSAADVGDSAKKFAVLVEWPALSAQTRRGSI
jgi:hypothetical protein